ncbi:MAG: MATE family efflux transporter, partial [Muribaculaceae bacterium]|nr:MATE family efflux transporter [Muribaculaceae bacterium]
MAQAKSDQLIALIREGRSMTLREQVMLTIRLSVPSILAQLTSIVMQYIDAAMVGSLGANEAASVGLVGSSIWLLGGICGAVATGFSVQVAHHIGANDMQQARSVMRQSILSCFLFAFALLAVGVGVSGGLPTWLGGNEVIASDASTYFLILSIGLPLLQFDFLASGIIRCSGNMRVPSMINIFMCVLDVVFNFLLIFPTRDINILGLNITMPGAGLGVPGAALGTILAEGVGCVLLMRYMLLKSPLLKISHERGNYRPTSLCLKKAVRIGLPMGLQHIFLCSAYVTTTIIVAPLGTIAIAAQSFGITAE